MAAHTTIDTTNKSDSKEMEIETIDPMNKEVIDKFTDTILQGIHYINSYNTYYKS